MQNIIEALWNERLTLTPSSTEAVKIVGECINKIDSGELRVAQKIEGNWQVNEWAKKAVLLSFRLNENRVVESFEKSKWFDKVESKFNSWNEQNFKTAGFRAVPGCFVRKGAFIAKSCVLLPSFVNIGAFVDEGTMVDTWSTIGSCAQIGKNCHISGGVGIGGVLEPLQANPVIIEDNCFIGARSEIAEGVIVEEGSVIGMGVYISSSTKIVNRQSGEIFYGKVPAGSVVVSGSVPSSGGVNLYAAIIVKTVDSKTRAKTSINELLRD